MPAAPWRGGRAGAVPACARWPRPLAAMPPAATAVAAHGACALPIRAATPLPPRRLPRPARSSNGRGGAPLRRTPCPAAAGGPQESSPEVVAKADDLINKLLKADGSAQVGAEGWGLDARRRWQACGAGWAGPDTGWHADRMLQSSVPAPSSTGRACRARCASARSQSHRRRRLASLPTPALPPTPPPPSPAVPNGGRKPHGV